MKQQVIYSTNLQKDISDILDKIPYNRLFLITDENTEKLCYPLIKECTVSAGKIVVNDGENTKNIHTLIKIWEYLSENEATRNSFIINLGGGMVTDLGGFAAATFKRGIKYINIPTTLLGAIDAAVGGKTAINLNGLKNEIGAFYPAEAVIINSEFLKTLPYPELLSGYAEMLKHALLKDENEFNKIISFDLDDINYEKLNSLIFESVTIKENIVTEDPYEKGLRKALNFGHTMGHAFESLSYKINQPVPHGYAIAWGIICELYLSHKFIKFPKEKLLQTIFFVKTYYPQFPFGCNEYDSLYELMKHDKKNNSSDEINFTLLDSIGEIKLNQTIEKNDIFESIDFLRENFGL